MRISTMAIVDPDQKLIFMNRPSIKPEPGKEMDMAIENSFWSLFWRGQVSGGLLTALTGATDVPLPVTQPFRKLPHMPEAELYLESGNASTARVAIAVSISGGPVTQYERRVTTTR